MDFIGTAEEVAIAHEETAAYGRPHCNDPWGVARSAVLFPVEWSINSSDRHPRPSLLATKSKMGCERPLSSHVTKRLFGKGAAKAWICTLAALLLCKPHESRSCPDEAVGLGIQQGTRHRSLPGIQRFQRSTIALDTSPTSLPKSDRCERRRGGHSTVRHLFSIGVMPLTTA